MVEFEVQESGARRNGNVPVLPPPGAQPPVSADERATLQGYIGEIDQYYTMIKAFEHSEPDEVMLACSGISARLTEIRGRLQRSGSARATQLRTKEVDPLLDEIREQFKIHSRVMSAREFDWKMAGGQT